ncbi:hypothetical protein [Pedobacter aquatilis]|uniref:hypothetical protein n=1 Tax=Pedobacter aquatilis TaxID=351343 RepID=UPI00292D0700|nr:hypothetical protein [Pedobacter aquatilis]
MSTSTLENDSNWSTLKKISFRFFFLLLVLLIFLNNNGAFLYVRQIFFYPTELLHWIIPWIAANILKHEYDTTIFTNGSGDTTYDYILLLFLFIVSVLGTVLWSFLDRKRANYNKLYYWLIVLVRFYLGFTLILYGSVKVIQLQFPQPFLNRLIQPFGDASPMGLAWTFLGLSKGYNIFMGIIEVSAILLLFKRTMIVGAFLSLAASVHVMAMNYFFDVPVKILSTTLVFMCLFILAPHMQAICRFFLTNQPQQLTPLQVPVFKKKWQLILFRTFKYLLIVLTVGTTFYNAIKQQYTYGALAPKPFLYGIYNVETFKLKGKEIPPLTTDSTRWKQLVISWPGYAQVKVMTDSSLNFTTVFNRKTKELVLTSRNQYNDQYKLKYSLLDKDHVVFSGLKNQDSVYVTFKRKDLKDFKLINRGFHWINEHPYNR